MNSYILCSNDLQENRALWESCKISLASSLQQPNKLYNAIEVQPTTAKNLVDHFEFYVNETAQKMRLSPEDGHFSAEGFAGGGQYEICVVAHPKNDIIGVQPIESNQRVSIRPIRLAHLWGCCS